MKFLIVFALALATASAFDLRGAEFKSQPVGVPVVKNEVRITNGSTASEDQFPYQVGISLHASVQTSYWCGGSLIGKEWVLTAAHCFHDIENITVYLGHTVRTKAEVSYKVSMDNVTIHHGWDSKTKLNDIAVIKIPFVTLSNRTQIVPLPAIASPYSSYCDEYVIVSGWGILSDAATSLSKYLQWGRMQTISNMACVGMHSLFATTAQLCVSPTGGVSVCIGDSGGPLVLESNGIQVGVCSYGSKHGCEKGYPTVFTRITNYLHWIKSITGIAY